MMWLESLVVIGVLALIVFGALSLLMTRKDVKPGPVTSGQWRTAHYDAKGVTRVVVQKVSSTGVNLLDEHVVAELHRDDPDYDTRFLEAMNAARQRQSIFEAEEA